jgi:ribose 5-phosphate isomerase RpiB
VLLVIGLVFTGSGIAYILNSLPAQTEGSVLWYLSFKFIAEPARSVFFLIGGLIISVFGFVQLNRHLFDVLQPHSLMPVVYDRNKPNVVIFGSGIGLLIFLNTIRDMVSGITVILPMGEDTQMYRELLNANQLGLLRNVFVSTIPNATMSAEFSDGYVLEGFLAIKDSKRFGSINKLFAKYRDDKPETTVPKTPTSSMLSPKLTRLFLVRHRCSWASSPACWRKTWRRLLGVRARRKFLSATS